MNYAEIVGLIFLGLVVIYILLRAGLGDVLLAILEAIFSGGGGSSGGSGFGGGSSGGGGATSDW